MKFQKFESHAREEGANKFLKLKDGQTLTAILRGEIYTYFNKWENGKSSIVVEGTPGAKVRFSVNAIVHENGAFTAKVWDFGKPVYEQLSEIHDEYPLITTKIKIKRNGTQLDTTYMIMPLLKDEDRLTLKQLEEIEKVDLHVLDRVPAKVKEEDSWNGF